MQIEGIVMRQVLEENCYDVDWIHEKTLFVNLLVGDQYKFEFSDFVFLRSQHGDLSFHVGIDMGHRSILVSLL